MYADRSHRRGIYIPMRNARQSLTCPKRDQASIRVVARDFTARFDPRLQTTMQRTNFFVALVHQQAGDTRRARFVGSTAINDDFVIGLIWIEKRLR